MLTLLSIRDALMLPLYWTKTSDSGQSTTNIGICCVLEPKSDIYRQDLDLGFISDGPTSVPNENWCNHQKVEGSLFYNPTLFSDYVDPYGYPYHKISGVPGGRCYYILAPGENHEDYYTYPFGYSDLTVVRQRRQPWGWDIAAFKVRYKTESKEPIPSLIDVYCWRIKPDGSVLSGHQYYTTSDKSHRISEHEVQWMKNACLDFMSCAVYPYRHVYRVHATATHYGGSIGIPSAPAMADWGELNYRALADIDAFSSNGIAYLSDMAKFVDTVKDSLALLKGKVDPKALSSAYLSVKYGWLNTIRDTGELLNALNPRSRRKRSTTAVSLADVPFGTQRNQVTIYYDPRDQVFDDLYETLRYFDLLPSGENLWDLVPMSFVVDWFVSIGPILGRIDIADRIQHLALKYGFRTTKTVQDFPASVVAPGTTGHVNVTRYVRSLSRDFDFPLFVTKDPSYMNHVVEGSALIIQRL